jgi:hypothetical protein
MVSVGAKLVVDSVQRVPRNAGGDVHISNALCSRELLEQCGELVPVRDVVTHLLPVAPPNRTSRRVHGSAVPYVLARRPVSRSKLCETPKRWLRRTPTRLRCNTSSSCRRPSPRKCSGQSRWRCGRCGFPVALYEMNPTRSFWQSLEPEFDEIEAVQLE